MNHKKNNAYSTPSQIGSPIDLLGEESNPKQANNRVMPGQFSFLTMPMGCTFVRNTNPEASDSGLE